MRTFNMITCSIFLASIAGILLAFVIGLILENKDHRLIDRYRDRIWSVMRICFIVLAAVVITSCMFGCEAPKKHEPYTTEIEQNYILLDEQVRQVTRDTYWWNYGEYRLLMTSIHYEYRDMDGEILRVVDYSSAGNGSIFRKLFKHGKLAYEVYYHGDSLVHEQEYQ